MGGKSRKSGGVSKKLIDRLKKGTQQSSGCQSKEKKKSSAPRLFELEEEETNGQAKPE